MLTQKFKGDDFELQMEEAAKPAFDSTDHALDDFYDGCYLASDWLLALYDAGRMPFSQRVPRDSFVDFFKQALGYFPSTGTFEAYLFILESIFGEGTDVQFEVPAAGKLEVLVNAASSLSFDFQAREFIGDGFNFFEMETVDGDTISFRGISGIDSEAELIQLLSELIPVGVFTDIALTFFEISSFIAEDTLGNEFLIIDHLGNQIIFFES